MSYELRFEANGATFGAWNAAQRWCEEHGFIVGPTQRAAPVGIAHADKCSGIAKWRNLSPDERAQLDGTIRAIGRPRDGDAIVSIRRHTPASLAATQEERGGP